MAVRGKVQYVYSASSFLYLRMIPKYQRPPLGRTEAKTQGIAHELPPLNRRNGWSWEHNAFGVIVYDAEHEEYFDDWTLVGSTQLFKTGEIWGIDAITPSTRFVGRDPIPLSVIPAKAAENILLQGLRRYVRFARDGLNIQGPLIVEAGITDTKGYYLGVENRYEPLWGPIHDQDITYRAVLEQGTPEEIDAFALALFRHIFDAAGRARPEHFHNFPPKPETP